jgi:hypothetical protein
MQASQAPCAVGNASGLLRLRAWRACLPLSAAANEASRSTLGQCWPTALCRRVRTRPQTTSNWPWPPDTRCIIPGPVHRSAVCRSTSGVGGGGSDQPAAAHGSPGINATRVGEAANTADYGSGSSSEGNSGSSNGSANGASTKGGDAATPTSAPGDASTHSKGAARPQVRSCH